MVYKIRRKSDGLFSTGGRCPDFKQGGKVWTSKGSLKRHISYMKFPELYSDCEIVYFTPSSTMGFGALGPKYGKKILQGTLK